MLSTPLTQFTRAVADLRSRPIVIKFGGSVQDDPAQTAAIIDDLAALARMGLRPIVVHGGGKAITAALAAAGLQSRFVAGQRYTDGPTLRVAERVLCGQVNAEICRLLTDRGVPAASLTSLSGCALTASRTSAQDAEGHPLDLGLVGQVEAVRTDLLMALCNAGTVPVLAPIAMDLDETSEVGRLNVNADLAAGMVARAIKPHAFILVSDTPGIRTIATDPSSCAKRLTTADIARLKASKVIDGGMLPKVDACLMALDAGVSHVAICDGRVPGATVASLLASEFPGTILAAE